MITDTDHDGSITVLCDNDQCPRFADTSKATTAYPDTLRADGWIINRWGQWCSRRCYEHDGQEEE
jgi:hypothetical protein